jgi:hypothetical protein
MAAATRGARLGTMTPKKTGKAKPPRPSAAASKAAPQKGHDKNKAAAAPPGTAAPVRRRDATGHLDPRYAAHLRAESGQLQGAAADDVAFIRGSKTKDDLAEELGEGAVATMTSGEYEGEDALDQVVEEEAGGPFVESTAGQEFAEGTDPSNPDTATREPFPKT